MTFTAAHAYTAFARSTTEATEAEIANDIETLAATGRQIADLATRIAVRSDSLNVATARPVRMALMVRMMVESIDSAFTPAAYAVIEEAALNAAPVEIAAPAHRVAA